MYPVQRVYLSKSNILLSIQYNVCTCHSPIYHYIIVTVVYLVYCITVVCVSWLCDHRAWISLGWIVSADAWVCWKSKNTCLKSCLRRNTYNRYHICVMRVLIVLLSIRYNVCACHGLVYHYITATAVYLIQRFITCLLYTSPSPRD